MAGTSANPHQLPPGLPAPVDDGACDHLPGSRVPAVRLASTGGRVADLAEVTERPTVLFFYPRTGEPGRTAGPEWDAIPGARGCTPQSCGFRDLHREFLRLGVAVFGVSTQDRDYQGEFAERNHVPFELLSDRDLALTRALRLPTFEYPVERGGPTTLIKRMAWYVERGRIEKVWYPVFPPDRNAETVLDWLRQRERVREIGRGEVRLA
ncbi:MAG TPA: peroxiredoxin [Methylomirabilota bacterium]|nr:peroxiredoxin [Methylomirabilota bacterium]